MKDFLPICRLDMNKRGWDECDFIYVIGDAYVDHPSFGPAIISRVLENNGYKVGIISQPDWKEKNSISALGKPRLGFLVSGGNMDTMVNHYTVAKKHRNQDAYTPGGVMGKRPDRAVICYCNLIRKSYRTIPIIIGGIEASLRRMAHYDYWSDSLKRSILLDSQADIISYGMGEHSITEIAECLASGMSVNDISYIKGTVYKAKKLDISEEYINLPDYDVIKSDKHKYAESFYIQYCNTDPFQGKTLVEKYKDNEYVIQNPPSYPLTQQEMDYVYSLPYMNNYHPSYEEAGGVPAIKEVKFSLVSNRGCFGSCNYCALTFHQGRIIQTRSHESIIEEAKKLVWDPDFKGYIHDVGGPTANFRAPACDKQLKSGACTGKQCLSPIPCKNLKINHLDYLELLRKLRDIPGVKKVFIRSGIRFDYLIYDKDKTFFKELCEHHISGQLKVAPEHVSDNALRYMGKPCHSVYERFREEYKNINKMLNMNQFLVPYLISSHPGTTIRDAVVLAEYLRDIGYMPEQVQDFYPTPGTISTCMYYTGLDPRTMEKMYVARSPHEKAMQRALMQYKNPKNFKIVEEALIFSGREDLIGYDKKCLIRPLKHIKSETRVNKKVKTNNKENKTKQSATFKASFDKNKKGTLVSTRNTKKPDTIRATGNTKKPDTIRATGNTKKPDIIKATGNAKKPDIIRAKGNAKIKKEKR